MIKLDDWEIEYLKKYDFNITNNNYDYVYRISEEILSDEIRNIHKNKVLAKKLWYLYEKFNDYLEELPE